MMFHSVLAFVPILARLTTAWGIPHPPHSPWAPPYASHYDRGLCQYPTKNPLEGCPRGTILVGSGQQHSTVQSAVLSLGNTTFPAFILIEAGNYTEQVNVTRPGPVTLLGVTDAPNDSSMNLVNIIWHNATGTNTTGTYDNLYTSVLTVAPTLNSSATGSGPTGNPVPANTPFGCTDFRSYNLNFINDYRPLSAGPSLAISISYSNASFYYSSLYSYQDTVYIGKLGNTYFHNGTIAGQTDQLYGFGTLWIQNSTLSLRGCGGGIVAWKGTNTTFINKYGAYIHDSYVLAANTSIAATIKGKCALGRPWNAQTRAIFANTYEDASIEPSGYVQWSSTDPRLNYNTTQAEYQVYGPGSSATGRAIAAAKGVVIEMTEAQYEPYSTVDVVFQYPFTAVAGNTAWIDRSPEVESVGWSMGPPRRGPAWLHA